MRRIFPSFILILTFLLLTTSVAEAQLRKNRLLKFDPAGGLFHELRVGMEYKVWREYWLYVAPFLQHQNWSPRNRFRFPQPILPQKYYGLGLRLGGRKYFGGDSPRGFFVNGMLGVQQQWVNQYDADLNFERRDNFQNLGLGATVGWQNLYGRKDNIAYGFHLGLEYWRIRNREFREELYVQNWYQFPFNWRPDALKGFRIYLGVEIGFAFLQKNLHW